MIYAKDVCSSSQTSNCDLLLKAGENVEATSYTMHITISAYKLYAAMQLQSFMYTTHNHTTDSTNMLSVETKFPLLSYTDNTQNSW